MYSLMDKAELFLLGMERTMMDKIILNNPYLFKIILRLQGKIVNIRILGDH